MLLENTRQVRTDEIERKQIGEQVFPTLPVRQKSLPRKCREQETKQKAKPDGEQVGRHDTMQALPEKDAVVGCAQVAEHNQETADMKKPFTRNPPLTNQKGLVSVKVLKWLNITE